MKVRFGKRRQHGGEEAGEGKETDVLLVDCISADTLEMGSVLSLAGHSDKEGRDKG